MILGETISETILWALISIYLSLNIGAFLIICVGIILIKSIPQARELLSGDIDIKEDKEPLYLSFIGFLIMPLAPLLILWVKKTIREYDENND